MSFLATYNLWIEEKVNRTELKKEIRKVRCPNFPEVISETVALNTLNVYYDNAYRRPKKRECGDLRKGDKKIEVKGVSSKGPISFGPKEEWDELYIVVCEENHKFSLYQSLHSSDSKIWKEMKVSKNDTFEDQKKNGRRPRITFEGLETQIQLRCIAKGIIPEVIENKTNSLEFCVLEYAPQKTLFIPKEYSNIKLRLIDLFCGVGGFHKALEDDIECVLANDFNKECSLTYKANFPSPFLLQDISTIAEIPECDVLTGGFPCQSFSIAGERKGFEDDRGQMFFQITRILRLKSPQVIILENVKNLVTHNEGKTLQTILTELSNLGYHVKYSVLNASTHGNVPQNRERVFFVGFKNKDSFDKFKFPSPIPLTVSVFDLLEKNVPEKYYYTSESSIYDCLKENVIDENVVYQYRRTGVRANKSGVCPTLTANMGKGGHNVCIILQGGRIRKLTPKECFLLQGNNLSLPNIADSHLYSQAGNSVCVPVVKRVWKAVLKCL